MPKKKTENIFKIGLSSTFRHKYITIIRSCQNISFFLHLPSLARWYFRQFDKSDLVFINFHFQLNKCRVNKVKKSENNVWFINFVSRNIYTRRWEMCRMSFLNKLFHFNYFVFDILLDICGKLELFMGHHKYWISVEMDCL